MKKILFLLIFLYSATFLNAQPCQEVVAYYASWKWYDRDKLVNPSTIDFSKYTIINYAFFKPQANGVIVPGDTWADSKLLGNSEYNSNLVEEARLNGVRVCISIGGYTWSDSFPVLASSVVTRKKFAIECSRIIRKYNVDGVDIDWEYPGYKAHGGSEQDKTNFTLLLKEIRSQLDLLELELNKSLILSIASGVSRTHINSIEWEKVEPLVDMVNLMTYNYSGPWDRFTNHHTPLFCSDQNLSLTSVDASLKYLINEKGFDSDKINLGMAFYARTAITLKDASLHSRSDMRPDDKTFRSDKGAPEYYNVLLNSHKYDYSWDDDCKVPFMTGKNGLKSFVSYDDPVSVGLKAGYVLSKKLRGAVIWELTGDYLETYPSSGLVGSTPLVSAINSVFCSQQAAVANSSSSDRKVSTMPTFIFSEQMVIDCCEFGIVKGLLILDSKGNVVAQLKNLTGDEITLDTSKWNTGVYLLKLEADEQVHLKKVIKI